MANDKRANFIVTLQDFMSGGLGAISAKLAILRQGWLAVSSVVTTAIGIFQEVLGEYAAQETAVNKLNIALKNQGIISQQVTQDYVKFADEMQNTTVFADEQVIEMEALLATFGVVGDTMKTTLKASADLATGLGIDLRTATMMLGKAALGETGTLSRYGIVIADNIPKAQKFAEVQRQVSERFGGSAAAQAETYAGKVTKLNNNFSDLKETIGGALLPAANAFLATLLNITKAIKDRVEGEAESITINKQVVLGFRQQRFELATLNETLNRYKDAGEASYIIDGKRITGVANVKKAIQDEIASNNEAIRVIDAKIVAVGKLNEAEKVSVKAKNKGVDPEEEKAAEEKKNKIIADAQSQIETQQNTEAELANIRTNAMAQELIDRGQHDLAIQLLQTQQATNDTIAKKKKEDEDKKFNENRAKNLVSTLQTISTLSNNHNKTLATIGKAAAISTATIDTFAAANKALASAPPPWNFGLAALVTAAGMANVAQISGMKLAEGGMVMPRNGGTVATMGEVGKAEVAIPLDDERTKEKLRDTLGGGGLTVIINAGTLIADDYSVDQFAQKIDEKLFELQRNGRSYR